MKESREIHNYYIYIAQEMHLQQYINIHRHTIHSMTYICIFIMYTYSHILCHQTALANDYIYIIKYLIQYINIHTYMYYMFTTRGAAAILVGVGTKECISIEIIIITIMVYLIFNYPQSIAGNKMLNITLHYWSKFSLIAIYTLLDETTIRNIF